MAAVAKSELRTGGAGSTASVAQVKSHLSSLIRSVEANRGEITVLRRGVAVAKIVPVDRAEAASGYGWMRGSVVELGDIIGPAADEWDVGDE